MTLAQGAGVQHGDQEKRGEELDAQAGGERGDCSGGRGGGVGRAPGLGGRDDLMLVARSLAVCS